VERQAFRGGPVRPTIPLRHRARDGTIAGVSTEDTTPPADGGDPAHGCDDDHCCDCCCCGSREDSEPSALGRALERLLGTTAAFCAVALMIGGTVALLRWWL
jgi:hypothetical protein